MLYVAQPVGAILLSEKKSLPFKAGRMSMPWIPLFPCLFPDR
jgi:hypothetical protein